ncbi:MAG TPA: enoyl-CoA hydratase/isomerase family protein, partial [Candidatus Krumholzibacteria bacterium]|nr:enoyl-CoA hydratase/isomerase family protein [Candidatus Krumholzibacteria bacterium]
MKEYIGQALAWRQVDGAVELELRRLPCNEIGSTTLAELELLVAALETVRDSSHALIIYSSVPAGFCAGADLRELYAGMQEVPSSAERTAGVRRFLERIHAVLNAIDMWPRPTIAAVHGVCF